jgi:hypothetical protein
LSNVQFRIQRAPRTESSAAIAPQALIEVRAMAGTMAIRWRKFFHDRAELERTPQAKDAHPLKTCER